MPLHILPDVVDRSGLQGCYGDPGIVRTRHINDGRCMGGRSDLVQDIKTRLGPEIVIEGHGLEGLVKQRTALTRTYKGTEYKAFLYPNGEITVKGKKYASPSGAAKAIVNREVNGLSFWYIQDLNGDWVKLGEQLKK